MQVKVPPSGPVPAKWMIVGEAPGENEVRQLSPFVGAAGMKLNEMLQAAGILRSQCFVTNVTGYRPNDNDISIFIPTKKKNITAAHRLHKDKHISKEIVEGLADLEQQIDLVRPDTIIALGGTALWALTDKDSISKWRGSELRHARTGTKVLPTYHPSYVLHAADAQATVIMDLKRAARNLDRDWPIPAWRWHIRPTFEEAIAILTYLLMSDPMPIAVDIETRGRKHISCIGLAWSPVDAICLPLMCIERPEGYWSLEEEHVIRDFLEKIFLKHDIAGQNFTYDQQYFVNDFFLYPPLSWDTMHSQHTLFPGQPKSLDYLASMHCNQYVYWKDDGKEWDLNTGEDQQWGYNCEDACRTWEVAESQKAAIEAAGLAPLNTWRNQELEPAVLRMMLRGVRYDSALVPQLRAEVNAAIALRQQRLEFLLGHPVNVSSPKQMHALFYTDFGEPKIWNTKNKPPTPTLDDGAMQKIAARTPILRPIINLILDIRSLRVFVQTFLDAQLSPDGRMRTAYNISGPYTFRYSSSQDAFDHGMNLQNLPAEGTKSYNKAKARGSADDIPDMRRLIIPDPGKIFWNFDLDRADLQVVVWEADDLELKQMLREGVDLHKENAKVLFGVQSVADVTKSMREFAKSFCHGTNYGGKPPTMAKATGVTTHQADLAQRRWFSAHPGIKSWHERTLNDIQTVRKVFNKFGFRWVIFDRPDEVLPEALAWIPQSTVACVINYGLVNIHNNLPHDQCEVLLQVHDSVAGQCLPDFPLADIKSQLLIPIPYPDPLTIPVSCKASHKSWGDCEDITI